MNPQRDLVPGIEGDDVARLHDALVTAGFAIDDAEAAGRQFGPTTSEAVRRVQTLCGIEPTGVVDAKTWGVVVVIIENIVGRGKGRPGHEHEHEHHHHGNGGGGGGTGPGGGSGFNVSGTVTDPDGNPLSRATVVAFDVAFRSKTELGRTLSGDDGRYEITYSGPAYQHDSTKAADLQMEVLDKGGAVVLTSDILFHAPAQAVIPLPLGGPARTQPSEFTRLQAALAKSLGTIPPAEITQDSQYQDLTFLTGETGYPESRIALYAASYRLNAEHTDLPPELFYGLFRMNVPADAATTVLASASAGVDLAGNSERLLEAALAVSANARAQAVQAAVSNNIIPASYASRMAADLALLTALAGDAALTSPKGMGKTPIGAVLTAAAVPPDTQKAFITTFAAATGPTRVFWKALYNDTRFTKAQVATLRFSVNVGRFTKGHLPLVNALVAMRNSGTIKGARDLARMSQAQWLALINSQPTGQPIGVPQNFTAQTPAATAAAYARLLERNFERAYPTTAFSARLAEDTASPLPARASVTTFLDANPQFTLIRTNIDRFIKDNPAAVAADPALPAALRTSQRLLKLANRYAVAKPLLASNVTSSRQVYAMGRSQFVARFGPNPDVGPAQAARVFAKAAQTYAVALKMVTTLNTAFVRNNPASIGSYDQATVAPLLADYPNLQTLFGSLDYCACDDCLSVLSPAAYLVDLLHYLSNRSAAGGQTAQTVLLGRRPDLTQVELSCPNTNTVLPYIDLVNELLESVVAPGDPMAVPRVRQTSLTTPELNANPQYVNVSAYVTLAKAVYPWILPLDLPLTEARVYLGRIGVTRAGLMAAFQPPIAAPSAAASALAVEILGSSPFEADIITGGPLASGFSDWDFWGLAQNTNSVPDPTDHSVVITGDWLTVLSHVRVLLARSGLSFPELLRVLNTQYISLVPSLTLVSNPPGSCDLGGMTLVSAPTDTGGNNNSTVPTLPPAGEPQGHGPVADKAPTTGSVPAGLRTRALPAAASLTAEPVDRLHRFVRLWRRLGWDVYDLDAAVAALQPVTVPSLTQLNGVLLRQLAAVKQAMARFSLSAQQAMAFFGTLDTRDVPVLPGDTPRPSLYHQLFQNLTVLNPVDPIFVLNSSDTEIAGIGSNPKLADHNSTLIAAFQVADADLALAVATFTDGSLKLANLSVLYRNVLLASSLGVSLSDFVSFKALVETATTVAPGFEVVDPFDPTRPERLGVFAGAVDRVKASGFSVTQLDYLLRGVADPSAGVAPDDVTVGTLIKSLRDGLVKIAAENAVAPDPTGAETRRRLSAVLARADVDTAMGILAGNTTLIPAQQTAFVTGTLGPFMPDPAAALAALVGAAALETGQVRYEFVLGNLLSYQRTTLGTSLVVHGLGVALALPDSTAAVLLTAWFPSRTTPGQKLIGDFLAMPGLARDPSVADQPVARTEPGFGPYFDAYTALDKAAQVIDGFGLTAAETAWLRDWGVALGWLDPTALPASAAPDAAGLFVRWARLGDYAAARDALPSVALPLTALFDLARTGATKAAYLAALVARTLWPLQSLRALCGDETDATKLGLLGLTYPDDYRSEVAVARLRPAFALISSTGVPAEVGGWVGADVTADQATAIKQAAKAKYSSDQWPAVAKPLRDSLRETQRDALVAYLLAAPPPAGVPSWSVPNDLYAYYLIDVEMGACGGTSRIVQASATVQLFVQRCFMNLEPQVTVDAIADADWLQWQWMSLYRVWEANREVFLYPENWIDPSLRLDNSPFFTDLVSELLQSDLSNDSAETAFGNYLEKLSGVARLDVCGMYHDVEKGVDLLHVLGRTQGIPPVYYYRQWVDTSHWTAWTKVDLDITSEHVLPVVWNNRLYAFWAVVNRKADQTQATPAPQTSSTPPPPPNAHLEVQLAWSEFKGSKWQAKQVAPQTLVYQDSGAEPFDLTLKSSFSGATLLIDIFVEFSYEISVPVFGFGRSLSIGIGTSFDSGLRAHIAQYRLGGVGNSVEAFMTSTAGLADVGPETRGIGVLDPALVQDNLHPPTQSIYDSNTLSPTSTSVLTALRSRVSPLNTTYDLYGTLASEVVLNQADWYRLLVPHQSYRFDSTLPFFHRDSARQYFVIPSVYYQNGNYFTTNAPAYVYHPFFRAEYRFEPFYHAFVPLFISVLNSGGFDALFDRNLQLKPETIQGTPAFDFNAYYGPTDVVLKPYPTEGVDFDFNAGYAIYNWELFFHAPFLIANSLSTNQKFDDARKWYEYIFDPSSTVNDTAPQRFWVTKPFNQLTAADYAAQQIGNLLKAVNAHDPVAEHEVAEWQQNPFEPHVIAQLRPVAYQRAVVMKYLDNGFAQGDNLFMQYTLESVNEARQYYIQNADLLGPRPVQVPPQPRPVMTYADLAAAGLDAFSDATVAAENAMGRVRVNVPVNPSTPKLPVLPTLYFCVPPNPKLLAYWDEVDDRLFKIRHCMNIQGVVQPLALFAPPIDPGLLVSAVAAGLDLGSALSDLSAATPPHRFAVMVRQASALVDEVRGLGSELLAALEKRDAEKLAQIRSGRERQLQNAVLTLRARQVDEASAQLDVLAKGRLVVQERYNFYTNIAYTNAWEAAALVAKGLTLIPDVASIVLDTASAVAHVVPDITVGATGFGGTPHVVVKFGGSNFGHASTSASKALRIASAILHTAAEMSSILGGYQRRADDWALQGRVAGRELDRIDSESAAASIRRDIANLELSNHSISVQEAADVDDFIHQKYTNQDLYDWMIGQISGVYFQAYQLAYGVAKQAEQCFRRELSVDETSYITFGYWDSLKKGLLSADLLLFDLKRMESAYYAQFARELEITQHVSLLSVDPYALVELRTNGTCNVTLPELYFDLGNPGHFMRRLKTVAVTVPCVVGPYGAVSLTLTLLDNHVRTTTDLTPGYARAPGDDLRFRDDIGGSQSVVTSGGQNDSGLFEVSLDDERYLPFEGFGAIATWQLRLNPVYPQFDYATITDVVLHLRYTARDGGANFATAAANAVKATLNQIALAESRKGLYRLVSARHDYGTSWARFLNPGPGNDQVLTLDTAPERFPFFTNGMDIKVTGIDVIATLNNSGAYTLVITPPGGASQTEALTVDGTLGSAYHWGTHPLAPAVDLGRAPSAKPYPAWTLKLQKSGAADFRSLAPGEISDLILIFQYQVS